MNICPKHKIRKKREPAGKLRCKLCNIEKSDEYLRSNPGYPRKMYLRNRASVMLRHAKERAEKKGIEFSISLEDIKIPRFCPVLGIRLVSGKGKKRNSSPTLDRIQPNLGYIKGNVIVISDLANRIKSNATVEEIEAVAKWMRSL